MGIVLSFLAGALFALLIFCMLQAASTTDDMSSIYWEGYRRGFEDARDAPP